MDGWLMDVTAVANKDEGEENQEPGTDTRAHESRNRLDRFSPPIKAAC